MVPTDVPNDNQAGWGKVSGELKPIELRPVCDKLPTARRVDLFAGRAYCMMIFIKWIKNQIPQRVMKL